MPARPRQAGEKGYAARKARERLQPLGGPRQSPHMQRRPVPVQAEGARLGERGAPGVAVLDAPRFDKGAVGSIHHDAGVCRVRDLDHRGWRRRSREESAGHGEHAVSLACLACRREVAGAADQAQDRGQDSAGGWRPAAGWQAADAGVHSRCIQPRGSACGQAGSLYQRRRVCAHGHGTFKVKAKAALTYTVSPRTARRIWPTGLWLANWTVKPLMRCPCWVNLQ